MPNSKFEEKKLSSEKIFSGKVFDITVDTVLLPDGKEALRELVHHSGGAAVLALNNKGEVALVRQFRYALGRETLEIPAGKIEVGEPPIDAARRELEEEAGCTSKNFQPFGQVVPTCAYCTEIIYIFLAKDLVASQQNLDEGEFLDVEWMPLEKAVQLVLDGTIKDSKTVSAILRAKLFEGKI